MRLYPCADIPEAASVLYDLLAERQPHESITHRELPTFEQHVAFLASNPYKLLFLIEDAGQYVGSCYVTQKDEIGVFVFKSHRGQGYGKFAVQELSRLHSPLIANIAPSNEASMRLFQSLGFVHRQNVLTR